jgi:hypothetical protein
MLVSCFQQFRIKVRHFSSLRRKVPTRHLGDAPISPAPRRLILGAPGAKFLGLRGRFDRQGRFGPVLRSRMRQRADDVIVLRTSWWFAWEAAQPGRRARCSWSNFGKHGRNGDGGTRKRLDSRMRRGPRTSRGGNPPHPRQLILAVNSSQKWASIRWPEPVSQSVPGSRVWRFQPQPRGSTGIPITGSPSGTAIYCQPACTNVAI